MSKHLFSNKELNYIQQQLLPHSTITPELIKEVFKDNEEVCQNAEQIIDAFIEKNIIDKETNSFIPAIENVAQIYYFSENENISIEDQLSAQQTAIENLQNEKIFNLK